MLDWDVNIMFETQTDKKLPKEKRKKKKNTE